MTIDAAALTVALAEIPSPTGAEGPVVEYLALYLAELGYRVQRQAVSAGRENLYAWREPPVLVFSTHLDVVPPHLPVSDDGTVIRGRGTCDAKGIAAAMIVAAERLAARGERRIGLLFVVGEEAGSDGAFAARTLEPKGRCLINGEPTENRLVVGAKGALTVRLRSEGRAAHSAYPDQGRSALLPLLDALQRIRAVPLGADPTLGEATLNIAEVRAGVAPNVIPPEATATLLIRTVSESAELRERLTAAAGPDVAVTFGLEIPVHRAPAPAGWETTTVSFGSDLPFHGAWGYGVMMGPGTIHVAHTDDEHITHADLAEGIARYVRLAEDLLAAEAAGHLPPQ